MIPTSTHPCNTKWEIVNHPIYHTGYVTLQHWASVEATTHMQHDHWNRSMYISQYIRGNGVHLQTVCKIMRAYAAQQDSSQDHLTICHIRSSWDACMHGSGRNDELQSIPSMHNSSYADHSNGSKVRAALWYDCATLCLLVKRHIFPNR